VEVGASALGRRHIQFPLTPASFFSERRFLIAAHLARWMAGQCFPRCGGVEEEYVGQWRSERWRWQWYEAKPSSPNSGLSLTRQPG
jgi:hypothetical protein